jgi:signal transduction histidine kinase
VTGEAFFRSLTRQLAQAFGADVAFVAEMLGDPPERARVLAVSHDEADLHQGFEFAIEGTPCSLIVAEDFVSIPDGTIARFPDDPFTARHELDSYLAVAMRGSSGGRIGYIGVQSRRRLDPNADERAALSIFGARAAAEIERRRHEVALRAREAEIAASRVRIVEAADEERRRIGRNLHDGAQQRLVSLALTIRLARRQLETNPEAVAASLEGAANELDLALAELRELARGLHPAALTEQGLGPAITAAVQRLSIEVDISVPDVRLPENIEATVYYIVLEALTNVARHAEATQAKVTVQVDDDVLRFEITDDGRGGADPASGTGILGLRDRAEAVGGTLFVISPPGKGTLVTAQLPLSPA